MRDLWKNHAGKIVLGMLLVVLVAINFRWGYFILGNDNYSPEENPQVSFERYLYSPTWREYRGLGVPSDSEQIDIFRSGFYLALEKVGVPLWLLSQMSVWVVFILGPWGMGWLCKRFYKKESGFLVGGITYLSSLLTLWMFFSPLKPFIYFWGFLPLFLAASDSLVEKKSVGRWIVWFLVLIGLSNAFIIPTLFIVSLGIVLGVGIAMGIKNRKWKELGIVFLIFLLWQMYWLIPFGWYVKNQAGQLQDSFINRGITSGTIQDEKQYNVLGNVVASVSSWVNIANDDGVRLFKYGKLYQYIWWRGLGLLPAVLAILGIYTAIRRKEKWGWWLTALMVGGIWLIKGSNPPAGFLYQWLVDNVPLFSQVFRWGSSKFWAVMWIPMVMLAVFGWLKLMEKESNRGVGVGMVLLLLVYVFPIFKGELVNDRDWVQIPQEYYDLRSYLEKVDSKGRVYLAPESNMLYFKNHDWGFFGSVFWSYWISNPVIEKALVTGSAENEEAYKKMVNMYYSGDPILFAKILNNHDIKWVIGDKSLTNKGNGYKYNWENYKNVIEDNVFLEKVWGGDKLALYQVRESDFEVKGEGERSVIILGKGKQFGNSVKETEGGYLIQNSNSVAGVYWDISNPVVAGKLVKISTEVENKSGIVAEINIRETKKEYQTFSYLGKEEGKEKMEGYFYLPSDWRNYLLELIVKARGPDMSVNEIRNLKLEVAPLTEDYLTAKMPEGKGWKWGKMVTYLGLGLNLIMVATLLTRQKLKRSKTNLSGNSNTTKA